MLRVELSVSHGGSVVDAAVPGALEPPCNSATARSNENMGGRSPLT